MSHGAVASQALGAKLVRSVLEDFEAAPIEEPLRATLRFLKKLTLAPDEVSAADAQAVRAAGVSDQAITDAILVCFAFNLMDRVADAFGFELPPAWLLRIVTRLPARKRSDRRPPVNTWKLLHDERLALAATLESLSPEQWTAPSQCDDWTVRDVAAHVAMCPLGLSKVLPAMARHGFRMYRGISALAREDRRAPQDLVQALRDRADLRATPPGGTGEHLLADIVLHAQDIRRPLGLPCGSSQDALRVAADLLVSSDYTCRSATRAKGLRLCATDVEWGHGKGGELRGPLHALVEAIGGRRAAFTDLSGPGADVLAKRCPAPQPRMPAAGA